MVMMARAGLGWANARSEVAGSQERGHLLLSSEVRLQRVGSRMNQPGLQMALIECDNNVSQERT